MVALFAALYAGISLAWVARPWGNKLPIYIIEAEYAVLSLTAFAATLAASGRVFRGFSMALLGYAVGLVVLLLVVKLAWPETVIGCYEDQWEWVCPGPLPVVTEGWGAVRSAASKLLMGAVLAALAAGCAGALRRWARADARGRLNLPQSRCP